MNPPWRNDPRLTKARDAALPDVVKARFLFPEVGTWELLGVKLDAVVDEGWAGKLVERPVTAPDAVIPGERVVLRPVRGHAIPVRLTPTIRANLTDFPVLCGGCSLDVHSEPLAEVWQRQFPDKPLKAEVWTTRCPVCRGTMFVGGPGVDLPHDEIRALAGRGRAIADRTRTPLRWWAAAGIAVLALAIAALALTFAR